MQPTLVTWALVVFGVVTLIPLAVAQLSILIRPDGQKSRELLIGKNEDWRDHTHFKMAVGAAWADWLIFVPIFAVGTVGMLLGRSWGYVFFGAAGACSLYINVILWFTEKHYVYPSRGPLKYFTYYWGFFVYWGALALAHSVIRIAGIEV